MVTPQIARGRRLLLTLFVVAVVMTAAAGAAALVTVCTPMAREFKEINGE